MSVIDEGILLKLLYAKKPGDIATETLNALRQVVYAISSIDENNFPNKISGGSVLLPDHSTPLTCLTVREWSIPLVLPPQPVSTTTSLDCGGFFVYDPTKFPGSTWKLEAAMKVSNAAGEATAQLKYGSTLIGSVKTSATDWIVVRGTALTMPAEQAALTVTLTSSSLSYTAYLWAARLVWEV